MRGGDTLVGGWYGNGNVGDEAILAGMVAAVRAVDPSHSLTAFSAAPHETRASLPIRATRRAFSMRGSQLLAELMTVPRYHLYALGGGGLIKDIGRRFGNARRWLIPLRAAQVLRRRTMMYAIGVEWVHDRSRHLIRRAAERCDLVTVRDRDSYRRLRAMGVETPIVVTADP